MAASLWPWLAVAAMGALHGLNPASGWPAAAWQARIGQGLPLRRLLLPLAWGHGASVLTVAAAVPLGLQLGVEFDARWLQGIAAVLLLALLLHHVLHRGGRPARTGAGFALWSFIVGTAHGAGWMLVPALVPLCATDMPGRELTASGSLVMGLAAVGVHLVAMLASTAAMSVIGQWLARSMRPRTP